MSAVTLNSSAVASPSASTSRSSSPLKPDMACISDLPKEDALGPTYRDSESPGSPSTSEASFQESVKPGAVEPKDFVTDEMLEEEKRLYSKGVEEEERRKKDQELVYQELAPENREKKFERLKYLLNKSTLYTQYLVERIKKQGEEEEKRKQNAQKRKAKKEQEMAKKGKDKQEGKASERDTRDTPKRKLAHDSTGDSESAGHQSKKMKVEGEKSLSPKANQTVNSKDVQSDKTQPKKEELGETLHSKEAPGTEEPALSEKASLFGVEEELERFAPNGEPIPYLQPKLMVGGVLRPYQVEGYSWLKVLYENGVNGILADEMGLGKTVQCVAMLAHLVYMGITGPFMVCAPLSTIPNWFAEFRRFAPEVPTVLYHGDREKRVMLCKEIRRLHKIRDNVHVQPVVITSYEIAMIDRQKLNNFEWKYLIVDEGHRIKNTHCRLIRELRMYRTTHRLLLTGTPLQNNLAELWSLLNFLLPEIFDDLGSFEAWFDAKSMNDAESNEQLVHQERSESVLRMLHQILTPFMLRRLKSDVDLNIPPKKEIMVYAPLTQLQREMYTALVDRTIIGYLQKKENLEENVETSQSGRPKRKSASKPIDYSLLMESDKDKKLDGKERGRRSWKKMEDEEKELESWIYAVADTKAKEDEPARRRNSQVTVQMRNVMMQLRKCCNHPYLIEHPLDPKTGLLALTDKVISTSGKMLVLDCMLPELKKRGHRVLIFSQMTRMLDLLEDYCQIRKYDFCRLDGSMNVDDRRENMGEFNEESSEKFIFLLSTRAGGLGINLTGADTVIIYDSDWNPQCDLQAQDRCHRIGQTKPVVVYRFVTANTIDQKIIERAAGKRKLEKIVIHKGSFKTGAFTTQVKPISAEELQELLQSKDHDVELKGDKFQISKTEMDMLLDRTDLYAKWGKGNETAEKKTCTLPAVKSEPEPKKSKGRKGKKQSTAAENQSAKTQSRLFEVVSNDAVSVSSEGSGNVGGIEASRNA